MKKTLYTLLCLCLVTGTALAKKNRKHKIHKHAKKGEKAAVIEERILDKRDTHKIMPEAGKDKRPEKLETYFNYTYSRIKALLQAGRITEKQGTEFKTKHSEIAKAIHFARSDKKISSNENTVLRGSLNQLNDAITAVVGDAEEGEERTPLLNTMQHRMEEAIEAGVRSGRISKGKASTLKRKLATVTRLEDRLKKDKEISAKEREKLFKEMNEVRRDLKRELYR